MLYLVDNPTQDKAKWKEFGKSCSVGRAFEAQKTHSYRVRILLRSFPNLFSNLLKNTKWCSSILMTLKTKAEFITIPLRISSSEDSIILPLIFLSLNEIIT